MEITVEQAKEITGIVAEPLFAMLSEFSREQVNEILELAGEDDPELTAAALHFANHVRETFITTLDVRMLDVPIDGTCEDVEVVDGPGDPDNEPGGLDWI